MSLMEMIKDFLRRLLGISDDDYDDDYDPTDTQETSKSTKKDIEYYKKPLMTYNEIVFFNKLKYLEQLRPNYKVFPQINLITIINKKNTRYHNELFRNIDYAIFDDKYNVLLLIELNDSSHKKSSRRSRDLKVKKIAANAGVKLITFYTSYPNEQNYVLNRVITEIEGKKEDSPSLPGNETKTEND